MSYYDDHEEALWGWHPQLPYTHTEKEQDHERK